ncbi:glycoside hydrolase [Paenibacillus sp. LHD-38]|uniref:glycoside hydrolase n=1 Tax=Paenibacillus sp. LHD-38 TaxID=3072143 RepID=UPI00280CFE89|nr:glycoside hydrolase [Paenibacillus sp. LHD-38]MDQ8733558.1 glycoside hydrolase [Paenibacillus sp. LHD-38]
MRKVLSATLIGAILFGNAFGNIQPVNAADATNVILDANTRYQTIHNFGASDAWSIDPIGKEWSEDNKNQIADLLFSLDKGIGLSGWRFNIGAGSNITDQDIVQTKWRMSEAFKQTETGEYDWTKQAGQQWFLEAAKKRGVDQYVAFSNSPPVWMTKNGHGQADNTVGSTNLKEGYEDEFASYLTDVVKHIQDDKGIQFQHISPINEPTWDWNRSNQEGNRYNNEDVKRVVNSIYDELQRQTVNSHIEIPEAVEYKALLDDETYMEYSGGNTPYMAGSNSAGTGKYREYIKDFIGDSEMKDKVGNMVAVHSYFSEGNNDLTNLRSIARENMDRYGGGELWMTEYSILGNYGPGRDLGIDPALYISKVIHHDLTVANVSAWQWWTAVSNVDYKDGLVYTDYQVPGDQQNVLDSKMLWALGNYSKFIRPDSERIAMTGLPNNDPNGFLGSAYMDETNKKVISVFINNTSEAKDIRLQTNNLPAGTKVFQYIPYVTSASDDLAEKSPVAAGTAYTVPAKSIVTLVGAYHDETAVPAEPILKSVKAEHQAITVDFEHVPGAESYTVKYGTASGQYTQETETFNNSTHTITGLTNGTTYYVAITAFNSNGQSNPSTEKQSVPNLFPPDDVKAIPGDGQVTISFVPRSGVSDYRIQVQPVVPGGAGQTKEVKAEPGTLHKSVITGLVNDAEYDVFVASVSGSEESTAVNLRVIPAAMPPAKVIAIPGDKEVKVEYSLVPETVGYHVQYGTESGSYEHKAESKAGTHTLTNLTNGTPYYVAVSSEGAGGESKPSDEISAVPSAENVVFEDSFEDGTVSAWSPLIGAWGESEGILKHQSGNSAQGAISVDDQRIIDGTITAVAVHAMPDADWGVFFRGTYDKSYKFLFENGKLHLRRGNDSISKSVDFNPELNGIYKLTVVLAGKNIKAYLDDRLIFDVNDTSYTGGGFGLHSWADAEFRYFKAAEAEGEPVLMAPELYAAQPSAGSILVSFSEVVGADSYRVHYGTANSVYSNTIETEEPRQMITGLENGVRYFVAVSAIKGDQESVVSNELSALPLIPADPWLLYYVKAGDDDPGTIKGSQMLGVKHSVKDQAYGTDAVTGKAWGYTTNGGTWSQNTGEGYFDGLRIDDGDAAGKGITYKFEVPNGRYKVTLGFKDPWNNNARTQTISLENQLDSPSFVPGNETVKQFTGVEVMDGTLDVGVLRDIANTGKYEDPMVSWIRVEIDTTGLLYYVDAGDNSPLVLESGESFGSMNRNEEQPFGVDPVTGLQWGYAAFGNSTWARTDASEADDTIRQYDGNASGPGKGLTYKFQVEKDSDKLYKVTLGFKDPWKSSNRYEDVIIEGKTVLSEYNIGAKVETKAFDGIIAADGTLEVEITRNVNHASGDKPMISWIKVEQTSENIPDPVLSGIEANETAVQLKAKDTHQIKVKAIYSDGSSKDLSAETQFASAHPEIANVDNNGLVTALKAGTTNIVIMYQGMSTVVALTVTPAVEGLIGLKAKVEGTENVRIGETLQTTVIAHYQDGSTADVTMYANYRSQSVKIASVDAAGLITGHKVGKTDIYADFAGKQASITIKVKPYKWKED